MWIIGVDYHPSVQQIAFVNTDTGEWGERRLNHSDGEAEKFYRELKAAGCRVRVGMEATGHARWFERLLAEEIDYSVLFRWFVGLNLDEELWDATTFSKNPCVRLLIQLCCAGIGWGRRSFFRHSVAFSGLPQSW
jgi:hypothetical protein